MATGSYRCSSNHALIADKVAVDEVVSQYNTHNQVSVQNDCLTISSSSDSMNVTRDGSGAQLDFLEDIASLLATPLRVENVLDHPREQTEMILFTAHPDGTVEQTRQPKATDT